MDEETARRPTAADLGVATRPGTRKSPPEAPLSHYVVALTMATVPLSLAGPLLCLWLLSDTPPHGPSSWDRRPAPGPPRAPPGRWPAPRRARAVGARHAARMARTGAVVAVATRAPSEPRPRL